MCLHNLYNTEKVIYIYIQSYADMARHTFLFFFLYQPVLLSGHNICNSPSHTMQGLDKKEQQKTCFDIGFFPDVSVFKPPESKKKWFIEVGIFKYV